MWKKKRHYQHLINSRVYLTRIQGLESSFSYMDTKSMDIYTTNPSTQYPTTMFYRTEDGVFDICKGCNMKIKVRGSKSNYPMRRHLASKSHKTLVSVHAWTIVVNTHRREVKTVIGCRVMGVYSKDRTPCTAEGYIRVVVISRLTTTSFGTL